MARVLLTGGNGFLASHILDLLLARGHHVVTTVRNEQKAHQIRQRHPNASDRQLEIVIIADFVKKGAFGDLFRVHSLVDIVIHTASPFRYSVSDIKLDLLEPAITGTTELLRAILDNSPSVKRVILTSSFAAILNSYKSNEWIDHAYSEKDWNPLTIEDALKNPLNGYRASKVFSEKAAWEFVETRKATFSLTTLCPTLMFGPVTKPWQTLDDLNTSNQRIQSFIAGDYKTEIPDTGKSFFLWADVRDVALAHIRVMEILSTANRRYLLTSGYFSNKEIGEIIREHFPENSEQLPELHIQTGGYPAKGVYGFDNSRATTELGLSYRTLTESVVDTVVSLQNFYRRGDTGAGST